eukprot:COSAG01_NODE_2581_length_7412_cov_9.886857_6_plen_88_part_00
MACVLVTKFVKEGMPVAEVLHINAAWVGDSGRLVERAADSTYAPNCGHGSGCNISSWLVYAKTIPVPPNQTRFGTCGALGGVGLRGE